MKLEELKRQIEEKGIEVELYEKLVSATTNDEVNAILLEYGLNADLDVKEYGELDLETLENVTGGGCGAPVGHLFHEFCRWLGRKVTGRDIMGPHC